MENLLDWNDWQTFLAVARCGSLSAAARALNTTQPTMGRRLNSLEKKLGARLLERHPKGYVLTNLGESILINAERVEAEILAIERAISGKDIALEGNVRLTTVDILASFLIIPAITQLQKIHPKISVEIIADARMLSLTRREADIAIRFKNFDSPDIVVRKLGSLKFGYFASKEYLESFGTPDKANSQNHQIITVQDDQLFLDDIQSLHKSLPSAKIVVRTNSRYTIFEAVKSGLGIAVLPLFLANSAPDLVEIELSQNLEKRDIWLGVHSDLRHTPRIRALIDAINTQISKIRT